MKFVDEVTVAVKAGDGGAGASHFRREKFVPRGGPDGGDGGRGGSVIVEATHSKRTLLDFRYQSRWEAENGESGSKNRKFGKDGADLILSVPVGTEIFRQDENGREEPVGDLAEDGARSIIARGGIGGRGNARFKSATNQAPRHAQSGRKGESGNFRLSLKLLADVGLLGLPNAGKSTLLSRISAAKPKIGDYPFTTREPQLGIVKTDSGKSFVVADIPGLIEGAHLGKGLGLQFLKHVERTKVLLHLVDLSPLLQEGGEEVLRRDLRTIDEELQQFSEEVAAKPRFLLFSKSDLLSEAHRAEVLEKVSEIAASEFPSAPFAVISSVSGNGISPCLQWISDILKDYSNEILE
ncbi:GTPase ObgE [bacterium]|nr:GTPase ObgE [bacterium]